MNLQVQLCAILHATPGTLVGWLHALAESFAVDLAAGAALVVGPHTFVADAPAPFETLAIYIVDKRTPQDIAARQVVFTVTYLPLRQPRIGLDLRVWPSFPATLETLKYQFSDYFTQASPVFSSAASLRYTTPSSTLACNRWLREQFHHPAYADFAAAKELYAAWIEQYRALRGTYPADPRRGFRALFASHQRDHPRK